MKHSYFMKWIVILLWMAIALNACDRCQRVNPLAARILIMGTLVEITVSHSDPEIIQAVTTQAFEEMKRIEQLMSTYIS